MKKLFIAAIMSLSLLTTSTFAEIKIGIILGFTGPIESLTPAMRDSAKLAFQEASDSGALLGEQQLLRKVKSLKELLLLWEQIVLVLPEQLQVM